MNVTYSEKVRQSRDEFARLKDATAQLEEVVGKSASRVTAEWDRTTDEKGQPAYTLRVSDPEDTASASFAPDVLAGPNRLGIRLIWIWDDVLRSRILKSLKRLEDDSEN